MKIESEAPENHGAARGVRSAMDSCVISPSARIVTTSWDDGDPCDWEVAKLLAERKLPGTFYVPVRGHHSAVRMDRADMLSLDAQGFEIGAHGISHKNLSRCSPRELAVEVEGSKQHLEDDMGKRILMFAYPGGRHNRSVIAAVQRAGYSGARTTKMLAHSTEFAPFSMPTSLQVYPHSRMQYIRNLLRAGALERGRNYLSRYWRVNDWVVLAKALFDVVLKSGGVWHLYGHSWEIEEMRLWDGLREILDYVSNRPGVLYLPNGQVVQMGLANSTRTKIYPPIARGSSRSDVPGGGEVRITQAG